MSSTITSAEKGMPEVKITSVMQNGQTVCINGSTKNQGLRRVEIIVNGDLSQRYIIRAAEDGTFSCQFKLLHNGTYSIEASIRDYSDFNKLRQPTPRDNYIELADANIWGSTITKHSDGLYYMIFAMWDTHNGFKTDWHQYSELGYAVSTRLGGPYVYRGKALDASYANITNKAPVMWPRGPVTVFHNPSILKSERDGKYYLYFMGTTTEGDAPSNKLQRVGVAVADTPAGPWTISEQPVIDVRERWDSSMTSNPSVVEMRREDGSYFYYIVHKGSGDYQGRHLCATGRGVADSPLGPFTRADAPIMHDPEVGFSVEDCYIWHHNGKYYALAKDMTKGNFTGVTGVFSYALFECEANDEWNISKHPLAFKNEIPWEDGTQTVTHLERSQLYVEDTVPCLISNATTKNGASPWVGNAPYNVQIPLLGVPLTADAYLLTVNNLADKAVDSTALRALLSRAEAADRNTFSLDAWRALQSAARAARVLLQRDNTEQYDIDFIAAELASILRTH